MLVQLTFFFVKSYYIIRYHSVRTFVFHCVNNKRDAQFLQSIFIPRFALHVSKESSRS